MSNDWRKPDPRLSGAPFLLDTELARFSPDFFAAHHKDGNREKAIASLPSHAPFKPAPRRSLPYEVRKVLKRT